MRAADGLYCARCRSSLTASDGGAPGLSLLIGPDSRPIAPGSASAPRDDPSTVGQGTDEWSDLTPASGADELPRMLARYRLREPLGRGGFGQVFRAYDPRLDRDVALKVLRRREPAGRTMERFFREARAAAQLDHPRIVALHDAGRDDHCCWIAYQFVAGVSLAEHRQATPLTVGEVCRLAIGVAEALEHAHARGVIHRDVKPGNVLIDQAGEPRLTDFGLARREGADPDLTRLGAVVGTRCYMSPEQAGGRTRAIDPRSDLYSLGVMIAELLTGRRPDPGNDAFAAAPGSYRWRSYRSPSGEPIPTSLVALCRTALAIDPVHRYRSATELIRDLERIASRHARGRRRRQC